MLKQAGFGDPALQLKSAELQADDFVRIEG